MRLRVAALALLSLGVAATAAGQSLLEAAEAGEHEAALAALKAGGDIDARGPDGTTALIWAAYYGDAELVGRLLAAGADANAQNEFGASALSEAAIGGYTDVVAALLKGGANADLPNPEGETALMEVARTGNVAAATLLLDAGADVNAIELWGQQSPLMWAAAQKQPAMIKLLISRGADVDARGAVRNWERKVIREPRPKDMNQGGFTPLLYAAREGCIECAKELVAGGADLNLPDPHRVTPLVMALMNLHFDFAAYLIEAGADVNKWDLYGRSPLYMATDTSTLPVAGNGSMVVLPSMDKLKAIDVARLLIDKGANVNAQLKRRPPYRNVPQDRGGDSILSQGATPLLRAARAGDTPMVKLLLENGALVDLPSNQGVTPLMAAAGVEFGLRVTRGRNRTDEEVLSTMRALLDAGADINARMLVEPRGESAAHLLVIEQRLSDYSYDYRGRQVPSARAKPHRTALHGAAMKGFTPIVKFLAENGADLYAKDANGATALDLAEGNYNEPFLRQAAEPHEETAAVLKELMAANPPPAQLSSASASR
ncbi:MAG TPA: ankyrin repeat domain-containing protein [Gammaproteobacteria bacterium]